MSNFQYINVLSHNSIGYINLNRPKVLNALSRSMVREIVNALEYFDQNDEIKVIIMSGEGRAFAAGADIDEMAEDDPVRFELLNQFKDWDRIALIKKPIIGAVHGFTLGGGFELALCCDILFAAENAQFGFPEIKLGVMPGAGGTQRLTKLMGKTKALEWLWLGEPMSAKEALHYGVVNRLVAPEILLEETVCFAEKIAMQPPLSLRLIKEAVQKAVDYSLYEGMQFERKNFYLLFSSQDQKEGMKAFIEKRKPNFEGK
ncbi:short chain enoyl-CoA hydratase [Schinkia azotoformans MEV2011]|uniref:Short chain enoyl-CoA hydratase n=1 Tax=Schinkia azotoformans MEV2011 TaxID=1348973 RepID=A0A072NID5_SCHAZ|nr:enoyl-CoA hydratase-related protein [Schinkia azotoformans]KEF37469.1 short chain enoyl-CoA hydratase [Schinkia azotoformans MEV2011]MEC1697794.1 enoyl-CoA hydratase-related protein [Schinkia azotoformans]MEC1726208.1 enoyl-CoA hydratase-related protein [Schinkia azotoformans]MEC1780110.1 enoyl-CoA hydratase-related protein [Schinkia azotoformans]MED4330811.1 enoyl-CoA hydratase-related protein [Schinkia azotoformans]